MTESDENLRDRFRATLLARAQTVGIQLAAAAHAAPSSPARREILGEPPHAQGRGAHARALVARQAVSRVRRKNARGSRPTPKHSAPWSMRCCSRSRPRHRQKAPTTSCTWRSPHSSRTRVARRLVQARAPRKAATPPGLTAAGKVGGVPRPGQTEGLSETWVQVSSRSIDDLTEALSRLSAELTALGPLLEVWTKERSTLERYDARARAEAPATWCPGRSSW